MRRGTLHVTPGSQTRAQAKATAVVGVLFAIFGVAFGAVVFTETSEPGVRIAIGAFFTLFVTVAVLIAFRSFRFAQGSADPATASLVDVVEAEGAGAPAPPGDFDERLRKLEALRNDGLVSEAEYQEKRTGILGERW